MYSIGIDIGTTSICGVLLDSSTGEIRKSVTRNSESFIPSDKTWEKIQDVSIIEKKSFEILDALFDEADGKVESIGISNQMHGILYINADGNCVSPLYIWQDERGNQPYKDGKSYAQFLNSFAGYGLVTDFYNRENGIVPQNADGCCTIGDYMGMKMCGNQKPVMHISNAASFGCFDLNSNRFTIDNGMLPEVTADFTVLGEYRGAKVIAAIGDNQASFMGSVSGNVPLVNVGTGSQVSYLSDKPVFGENIESRPYDGRKFLVVGCSLCGGRAFALLERFFASVAELATGEKCDSLYKQIDKMLETKLSTDMTADSRFCGTRANPNIRGGYFNVSEDNFTAGDMAVATLYAIANELKDMYGGEDSAEIVCSGNGIRKNAALQKVVSEVFSAEIKIPRHMEEASYGVALASLTAVGRYDSLDEAQKLINYR
ncbi:MAG: hypothetical protein MJ168_11910 [Clostridia bacterium]|nr:hypothetical protein [Clostridia bacterium]